MSDTAPTSARQRSADRPSVTAATVGLTPATIERRAYEKFVARGSVHGYDVDDWYQAERELLAEVAPARRTDAKPARKAPAKASGKAGAATGAKASAKKATKTSAKKATSEKTSASSATKATSEKTSAPKKATSKKSANRRTAKEG